MICYISDVVTFGSLSLFSLVAKINDCMRTGALEGASQPLDRDLTSVRRDVWVFAHHQHKRAIAKLIVIQT